MYTTRRQFVKAGCKGFMPVKAVSSNQYWLRKHNAKTLTSTATPATSRRRGTIVAIPPDVAAVQQFFPNLGEL